jgi:subtilase family serine protease
MKSGIARVLLASTVLASSIAVAAGPSGASAPRSLLGAVLNAIVPLGCANPANHQSPQHLLPAASTRGASVTCFGQARAASGRVGPAISPGPVGYGPAQLQSAYKLKGLKAKGRTVAIVSPYDDPKAEADLAVYRATFRLPACTTANHCFRKVNQVGQAAPLPARDYGWAQEISLDLDAVSATCPDCHILLVEASSPALSALMTAVDTAVRLGAFAVSQSYGTAEDASILAWDKHLNHPGVAITAATGDDGYGAQWPASSRYVTAVGGTTLVPAKNARGWTETAWRLSGSGCSRYEPKPSWQHVAGCSKRAVADVSADADPNTGLGVYDTFNSCALALLCDTLISSGFAQGSNGWLQIGGTSLSAPIIAAVYALAGHRVNAGSYPYAHTGSLNDVRAGANGSCGGALLCTSKTGYDGPTGLGTPNGIGAF